MHSQQFLFDRCCLITYLICASLFIMQGTRFLSAISIWNSRWSLRHFRMLFWINIEFAPAFHILFLNLIIIIFLKAWKVVSRVSYDRGDIQSRFFIYSFGHSLSGLAPCTHLTKVLVLISSWNLARLLVASVSLIWLHCKEKPAPSPSSLVAVGGPFLVDVRSWQAMLSL